MEGYYLNNLFNELLHLVLNELLHLDINDVILLAIIIVIIIIIVVISNFLIATSKFPKLLNNIQNFSKVLIYFSNILPLPVLNLIGILIGIICKKTSEFFRGKRMENLLIFELKKYFKELSINEIYVQDILKSMFDTIDKKYIKYTKNYQHTLDKTLIHKKFLADEKATIVFLILFIEEAEKHNIKINKYQKEKLFNLINEIIKDFKKIISNFTNVDKENYEKVDNALSKGDIFFLYSTKDFLLYYLNDTTAKLEEVKDFLILDSIRNIKKINIIHGLVELNRDWPFQVDIVYPDYLNIEINQIFPRNADSKINSSDDLIGRIKYNIENESQNFSYLIIGESGIGKTTLMTQLFYEILLLYKENKTSLVPLFFEIKDIENIFKSDNNINNYEEFLIFILNEFIKKDLNQDKEALIEKNTQDGKIYFKYNGRKKRLNNISSLLKVFPILDSLDEAYQNIRRGGLKNKKFEFLSYIVSSRANYFLEAIYDEFNFSFCDEVFKIKKWNQVQIEKLINALNERLNQFYNVKANEETVNNISKNIDNPLLAILLLFTYVYKKDRQNIEEISKNKSLLYKLFFEVWIERESNKENSIFSKFKKENKVENIHDLYKLFSDTAIFFAWLLFNKQMGIDDENIKKILDNNLNLSIRLDNKLASILKSEIPMYVYDFRKQNEILEKEYKKFNDNDNNYFEDLFLSNELKSILQISENIINKFIHESFMEFFIAESIIRELSLDYEKIDFKILSYYYRYDIARFILGLFEYYNNDKIIKMANNLNTFLKEKIAEIKKGNYKSDTLHKSNFAGYFLSRILFHNKNIKGCEKYNNYIETLKNIIKTDKIPHISKRAAYNGLMILGENEVKEEYLKKLTSDEETFWFNIGDILIYHSDRKKDENISLDLWKASLKEFLEDDINWNFTRKRFLIDILDTSEKSKNLKEYRIKTFLHLAKLAIVGKIYKCIQEKFENQENQNIEVSISFNGNKISFEFNKLNNVVLSEELEKEINGIIKEYVKKIKEEALKYLGTKEKIDELFSELRKDKDNEFKIIINNNQNSYEIVERLF
ncbi:NACHT domain-containing protein [Persephonella sp.]